MGGNGGGHTGAGSGSACHCLARTAFPDSHCQVGGGVDRHEFYICAFRSDGVGFELGAYLIEWDVGWGIDEYHAVGISHRDGSQPQEAN